VTAHDFHCDYYAAQHKKWKKVKPGTTFLSIAGGDGTVRKVVLQLWDYLSSNRVPLALLPLGTANNIAGALGIRDKVPQIIPGWKQSRLQPFDVGTASGKYYSGLFLESIGFGLFPRLIREMEELSLNPGSPAEELKLAIRTLHDLVYSFEARPCRITVDHREYTGNFLWVEIMNIDRIGPNVHLAPEARFDDGFLDVVLIPESQRALLWSYILQYRKNRNVAAPFKVIRGKKIKVAWMGKEMHVDDQRIKAKAPIKLKVKLRKEKLAFLIPGAGT
jgi:diacylglycerol kinase (ATP)